MAARSVKKPFVVHGTVTDAQGKPVSGAGVTVWHQRIRDRLRLKVGTTGLDGTYSISYQPPEGRAGKLLIVVEARSRKLKSPIASTATAAQPDLTIDLAAQPRDQSEYAELLRAVRPYLQRLELIDIVENDEHHDISFLAEETGNAKEQIVRVAISARLEEANKINGAVFFAFLRQHIPSSLPTPLLDATENFTLIDGLVSRIGSLIFGLSSQVQTGALQAAVQSNIIGPQFANEIPGQVESLQKFRITDVLANPYLVGKTSLGDLLSISGLAASKNQAFATALTNNTQSMTKFWTTLGDGTHGFTPAEVSSIERTLSIGTFVKNHVPLLQLLLQRFTTGAATQLSDLARLTLKDWEDLVQQSGPPPSIDGAGAVSPAEIFARIVYARVTRAFPTIALASRIVSGGLVPIPQQAPLNQFFTNNTQLNLLRNNVGAYLTQEGDKAFAGIAPADRTAVVSNVRRMQRVLYVTAEVDAAQTLLTMGIHSATQIAMMGRQQFFLSATKAGLTKPESNRMYSTAVQRYSGLLALYTQLNRDAIGVWPKSIGDVTVLDGPMAEAVARDESLSTLFGSQDYCAVDSCTSILSPAAYLCDLLHWLRARMTGAQSALDVLNMRRPDIANLKLNCPNSETPLPYIDLVNEILSDAIGPLLPWAASTVQGVGDQILDSNGNVEQTTIPGTTGGLAPAWNSAVGGSTNDGTVTWLNMGGPWKQTSDGKTAADLLAAPEYFNQNAYMKIFGADYPHVLPYSEGLDELRAYLQQFGIALWQLRKALLPLHSPTLAQQAAVAAERFTMAPHGIDLVTSANFVPATVAWHTAAPPTDLVPVQAFTHAATITYDQLLQLLQARWVQGTVEILISGINDLCDTSKEMLVPCTTLASDIASSQTTITVASDAGFPGPTFQVVIGAETLSVSAVGGTDNTTWTVLRGQVGTTASAAAAGDLVMAIPPVPLDADILDRAHRFLRLWRSTGYRMWELDLLLESEAVLNGAIDQNGLVALGAFRLLQDETNLPADALLAWFQAMDTLDHRAPDDATTTPLYSRVFLNPAIVLLHPDADLAAVASGAAMNDGNLSHHLDAIQASLGLSGADVSTLVSTFSLDGANTLTLDNLSTLFRVTQFASVAKVSIGDLSGVAMMMNPGAPNVAAALNSFFANLKAATDSLHTFKAIRQSGFSIDALTYLLTPPAATPPLWNATTGMTDTAIAAALDAVRQGILNPSGGDINGTVMAAVAAQLSLANDITAFLTQSVNLPGTATSLLAVLTDASITTPAGGPYPPFTRAAYTNQFVAIQLLDKIRVVVQKLHLVNADLSWLVSNAGVYGGLDFTALPVLSTQPAIGSSALLTTVLLVQLARLFTAAPPAAPFQTLYDVIAAVHTGALTTEADAQAALSAITGWEIADCAAFATALGVVFAADYLTPSTYDALRTLGAMIAATSGNGTAAQLVAWSSTPTDEKAAESMAASALSVLKARYSDSDWLAVAPSIMNPLREDRSAALQEYLIGNGDAAGHTFEDVNALFDFFLIDTQMSSCEVTTRVIQAYVAVQIFVERCRMNLEADNSTEWPGISNVIVDPNDDAWEWWSWMKRYRIWEAAREVFLYPENWLIESQRASRTEIYRTLEQDVHQGEQVTDYFETVTLKYLDGLDDVAHPVVTGTCQDPATKAIHVVARAQADPPRYYHRVFQDGQWSGWVKIPLDIKALHVVPAVYRNSLCLFWPDIQVHKEPRQNVPSIEPSTDPPSQDVARYTSIALSFSAFRNGAWSPAQAAKGKLFDIPNLDTQTATDARAVAARYSLKVQISQPSATYGPSLFVDVFRFDDYSVNAVAAPDFFGNWTTWSSVAGEQPTAVHVGRAVFDGRFGDLELRHIATLYNGPGDLSMLSLLTHAQRLYGPDAQALIPLTSPDPDLTGEPGLTPQNGGLITQARGAGQPATIPLSFTSIAHEVPAGSVTLLSTAPVPFSIVGPVNSLNFDPTSYFFYQDNRRCYFVDTQRWYWSGSMWTPVPPSNPSAAPFEARYYFHRFYHPYTHLLWHQLSSDGFLGIYNTPLEENPDQVDPSHADVFSFSATYQPVAPRVSWGENNEILDFSPDAAYSVYNWELFFHVPLYVAGLLSQNQQFEDAMKWFHYIFDPTRQGTDPTPQRFWIPKPLHDLTSAAILQQRINNLLLLVNQGDPGAVGQVRRWRDDPFNPFALADLRPVAYMKSVVMQYLDNLIAWADNLFATDSREALSEATLLYVIAAEILGPQPTAIMPPKHADDSYNELAPKLDEFANAMVDIENTLGAGGGGMGGGGSSLPMPQTFYFKIPPNDKLLGYWTTVGDRLFKLRHCQNIQGVTRQLALFDAPIDPGLLVKAQAAGVDLGSVLSEVDVLLPNYRYTALYTQALDFVNAVRAYGSALQAALEKSDADALAVMTATNQQQLLSDADQIFAWQIELASNAIAALQSTRNSADQKYNHYNDLTKAENFANLSEWTSVALAATAAVFNAIATGAKSGSAAAHALPDVTVGVMGFGGTAVAIVKEGGSHAGHAASEGGNAIAVLAGIFEKAGGIAKTMGDWWHRHDDNQQKATEAQADRDKADIQLAGLNIALQIAQQNQTNHQTQIDQLQTQIDFLTNKFTNKDLYDWMAGQLADTYFQSYKLAYRLCKQVEKCYQYELGIPDSNFIQFGYWDSLHKGLLAGETMNNDLRRMQSSYLDMNKRRFELSRFVSLAALDPDALRQLLKAGACDFDIPESLFDEDYPGHYNRHLVRVSTTVVYPSPGKFDNVKATLKMTKNKVRISTTASSSADYAEVGPTDPRFFYNYGAVPQKIALGNAQDDPGLFQTALSSNLSDQRYLPFEGAGAISSWTLELPQASNEIDLGGVSDIILHLYYTAQDGGDALKQIVEQFNAGNLPTSGAKVFSAANDFPAASPTVDVPYPVSPWQAFLSKQPAIVGAMPYQVDGLQRWQAFNNPPTAETSDPAHPGQQKPVSSDQVLKLTFSPGKFPPWTRGRTISVLSLTLVTLSWPSGVSFVLVPQAPLPTAPITMNPEAGVSEPNICSATITLPPNTPLGTWQFKLQKQGAADFQSLTKDDLSDILIMVNFQVS